MGNIDTKSVDVKSLLENQNSQVQDFVNTAISGANTQNNRICRNIRWNHNE